LPVTVSDARGLEVKEHSRSRVIFALDFSSLELARSVALALREPVGMFKVGLELFVEAGRDAIAIGPATERPIFLDLKLHDIPKTVERAVARASALGARMLTVHASGGPMMLRRAVERAAREGAGLEIAAVTVLTSLDTPELRALGWATDVGTQVELLANLASSEGVRTFVCSPHEAARLRARLGDKATLITPGVRASGAPASDDPKHTSDKKQQTSDDQKRTMSAGEAVRAGADWVVVGRPIRDAADPLSAAKAIAREVEDALAARRA
jgi:orotidine-5'-phosphate decarboxylase